MLTNYYVNEFIEMQISQLRVEYTSYQITCCFFSYTACIVLLEVFCTFTVCGNI